MADPQEGTHRGGMLRPSMHPIKPQHALPLCCAPQHPTTPPQPIMGHRLVSTPTGTGTAWSSLQETACLQPHQPCMSAFWDLNRGAAMASATTQSCAMSLRYCWQHATACSTAEWAVRCRAWESPFKGSPQDSADSSLFSTHSSYDSITILGDVQPFSAPSFNRASYMEVRPLQPPGLCCSACAAASRSCPQPGRPAFSVMFCAAITTLELVQWCPRFIAISADCTVCFCRPAGRFAHGTAHALAMLCLKTVCNAAVEI